MSDEAPLSKYLRLLSISRARAEAFRRRSNRTICRAKREHIVVDDGAWYEEVAECDGVRVTAKRVTVRGGRDHPELRS